MIKPKYPKLCLLLFALVLLLCSCSPGVPQEVSVYEQATATTGPDVTPQDAPTTTPQTEESASPVPSGLPEQSEAAERTEPQPQQIPLDETLQVFVFDVGQADCILVKTGRHAMLIDAGDTGQGKLILGYLSDNGVTELDYLAATHPHADHIGSMPEIIEAMDSVGSLLMPDVVHTTKSFENLLDAVEEHEIPVTIPQPGETFVLGSARIQILAPNNSNYADLNNYSIVLRVDFGQSSFLFTGDAEDISESEQLANGYELRADVIKVGHHGSHSSSTQKYIEAVSPSYAVISVGKGNTYGHPHNETLACLSAIGATVYCTDVNGTITFLSDGETIEVNAQRVGGAESETPIVTDSEEASTAQPESNNTQYIGNKNSKIFHKPSCGTLPAEKNRVYFGSRDEAIDSQYRACQRCDP